MMQNKILRQAIKWVESQSTIRAVILVGSHAEQRPTDELSDYDLSLFCTQSTSFIESDNWLEEIAKIWVSIPEKFIFQGITIPTRLAIFEDGYKIDFAFYPLKILEDLAKTKNLPDEYNMGYKVLIDKDRLTRGMLKPSFEGFKEQQPSDEEFYDLLKEFWFEIYHVAKYLYRQDLWSMQFRLSGIHHNYMIKMICWNEASKCNWNYTTNSIGKRMQEWVHENTWQAACQLFPYSETGDGWNSLEKTIDLFTRLAKETASNLDYNYPVDIESSMGGFVKSLAVQSNKGNRHG